MAAKGADMARQRAERRKRRMESKNAGTSNKKARFEDHASVDIPSTSSDPMELVHPHPQPSLSLPTPEPTPALAPAPSPSPPPPALRPSGRPAREVRLPVRFRQDNPLPEAPPAVVRSDAEEIPRLPQVRLIVRDTMRTLRNAFGLFREYLHRPTHDPDSSVATEDLANVPDTSSGPTSMDGTTGSVDREPPWPFSSMSIYRYMTWLNTGGTSKTYAEADRLADIISSPDFEPGDLKGFNAKRESQRLDQAKADQSKNFIDGFTKASINIDIPSGQKDVPPSKFPVHGLYYRDLLGAIKSAFSHPLSLKFHLSPFKLFHVAEGSEEPTRAYSELYNSDAFIQEHDRVQRAQLPADSPDCKLERVVAALMFWSDATQLANFGDAKLWPIYLFFGNLSKYIRGQPTSGACHHIAYIPSLPDLFADFARDAHSKWRTQQKDILAHCRREVMHAVWAFLLTDEFVHAYRYGIVIECADGIKRRVYPRIFTYSADYPEKVLLANIRDKGLCPCPRCLTPKSAFWRMGMKLDLRFRLKNVRRYLLHTVLQVRKYIHEYGWPIKGKHIEQLLKPISAVPTVNAFVSRLGEDFDPCKMLVVDLMHEFKLGVWKNLFTHLIRMLYAMPNGAGLVQELNMRQVSPFGSSKTIRRFANDVSEMKKLAARDFEDLLQGLLPEPYNRQVMKLLYRAAEWHALAKLRMHTDSTVSELKTLSTELGNLLRSFRDTTSHFNCVELPREARARARRQKAQNPDSDLSSSRQKKTLNLDIYKFHAMADYAGTILEFGPTDGYSTQLGEMCHQPVKRFYTLTNKRDAAGQIAKRYRRNAILRPECVEGTDVIVPELHHQISNRRDTVIHLRPWLQENASEPTKKNFVPKLKDHLLARLSRSLTASEGNFTDSDRNKVVILGNKIYSVKTMRINYTTYDVRRDSDLVNCNNDQCFVMVRSETSDTHPLWYAHILGIFHAQVYVEKSQVPQFVEFLWVHWMEVAHRGNGRNPAQLPKLEYLPAENESAFGFLDPNAVVRASHLIPQFAVGRTAEVSSYYVNLFVDRDMFMRYHGGGLGHVDIVQPTGRELDDEIPVNEEGFEDIEESEDVLDNGITEGIHTATETEAAFRDGHEGTISLDDDQAEEIIADSDDEEYENDFDNDDSDEDDGDVGGENDSDYGDL
ncbi:hypothetical protein VNI00_016223 [Paramarasmius palmivorus]|uniref:Uncharacterized protein n=1 Tax=Paramarasmius palmivorus TaxID=297713 RepID=A0AAW0BG02_9AGAR